MPQTPLDVIPEHEKATQVEYQTKVLHSGECEHFFVDHHHDSEIGKVNVRCSKCPLGTIYDPETEQVENGKIIPKRIS